VIEKGRNEMSSYVSSDKRPERSGPPADPLPRAVTHLADWGPAERMLGQLDAQLRADPYLASLWLLQSCRMAAVRLTAAEGGYCDLATLCRWLEEKQAWLEHREAYEKLMAVDFYEAFLRIYRPEGLGLPARGDLSASEILGQGWWRGGMGQRKGLWDPGRWLRPDGIKRLAETASQRIRGGRSLPPENKDKICTLLEEIKEIRLFGRDDLLTLGQLYHQLAASDIYPADEFTLLQDGRDLGEIQFKMAGILARLMSLPLQADLLGTACLIPDWTVQLRPEHQPPKPAGVDVSRRPDPPLGLLSVPEQRAWLEACRQSLEEGLRRRIEIIHVVRRLREKIRTLRPRTKPDPLIALLFERPVLSTHTIARGLDLKLRSAQELCLGLAGNPLRARRGSIGDGHGSSQEAEAGVVMDGFTDRAAAYRLPRAGLGIRPAVQAEAVLVPLQGNPGQQIWCCPELLTLK